MSASLLWFDTESRKRAGRCGRIGSKVRSRRLFGLAMVSVLWAYEGWQFATFTPARR
jgi:hypothetical protein